MSRVGLAFITPLARFVLEPAVLLLAVLERLAPESLIAFQSFRRLLSR